MTFNTLPRADELFVEGDHDLYRVWQIPGRRDSDYYDGSGVKETFNLAPTDLEYPPNENACPVLAKVKVGNTKYEILRKNINHKTVFCPECSVEGKRTHSGEKFCPECGLLLSKTDSKNVDYHLQAGVKGQVISRTANDAERYPEQD